MRSLTLSLAFVATSAVLGARAPRAPGAHHATHPVARAAPARSPVALASAVAEDVSMGGMFTTSKPEDRRIGAAERVPASYSSRERGARALPHGAHRAFLDTRGKSPNIRAESVFGSLAPLTGFPRYAAAKADASSAVAPLKVSRGVRVFEGRPQLSSTRVSSASVARGRRRRHSRA